MAQVNKRTGAGSRAGLATKQTPKRRDAILRTICFAWATDRESAKQAEPLPVIAT